MFNSLKKNPKLMWAVIAAAVLMLLVIIASMTSSPATDSINSADAVEVSATGDSVTVRGVSFDCYDIRATYNEVSELGREMAVSHVGTMMNIRTEFSPFISAGDAQRAVEACE